MSFDPEERALRARALFREGYNCTQSVVLAFIDLCAEKGITEDSLKALACGFGGGMARMREVCGTVSAMSMLAGIISPAANPGAMDERRANYALVQKFADSFREKNGSIVCRELLQQKVRLKEDPMPSERTQEYYDSRPCERLIGCAASMVARYLKHMEEVQETEKQDTKAPETETEYGGIGG